MTVGMPSEQQHKVEEMRPYSNCDHDDTAVSLQDVSIALEGGLQGCGSAEDALPCQIDSDVCDTLDEDITLTICFLGTSDSYPLHADRLVGRVYDALGGEEFVHKVIIDGPGSGGLDLDRRWSSDRAWNKIMGVTFGAGMGDNVANAMAIIKRCPTRSDKEALAADVRKKGMVKRVNLFGHSRGGVQCYRLAWDMYHDPVTADIEVNCIVMDPVPGPANSFMKRNTTFPPNVRHAQVWIAEHEHSLGFEALLPTVLDPSRTHLWLDLLPGNHVNMCVDATLEPMLIDASGHPTKIRLEPELFRLSYALTLDFLSRHRSRVGDGDRPAYLLTDGEYLRLYDSIARRWDAYCGQASMLQWARATAFERDNMRRMKQNGEFNVCHFTDVDELCEFYRQHRQETGKMELPVVNRHHDLLLRYGGDAWQLAFSQLPPDRASPRLSKSPERPESKSPESSASPQLLPASARPSWLPWDAWKTLNRMARRTWRPLKLHTKTQQKTAEEENELPPLDLRETFEQTEAEGLPTAGDDLPAGVEDAMARPVAGHENYGPEVPSLDNGLCVRQRGMTSPSGEYISLRATNFSPNSECRSQRLSPSTMIEAGKRHIRTCSEASALSCQLYKATLEIPGKPSDIIGSMKLRFGRQAIPRPDNARGQRPRRRHSV